MVNLDNDFQIMTSIRKLSDTTCDKLIFTVWALCACTVYTASILIYVLEMSRPGFWLGI